MTSKTKSVHRLLDANINRVREGLRVCEDITRFIYNFAYLARSFKKLRHRVTEVQEQLPGGYTRLTLERDVKRDAGKDSVIQGKGTADIEAIFIKNIKRAQEAMRVLEELSKLYSYTVSAEFQKLRFTIYELETKTIAKL